MNGKESSFMLSVHIGLLGDSNDYKSELMAIGVIKGLNLMAYNIDSFVSKKNNEQNIKWDFDEL